MKIVCRKGMDKEGQEIFSSEIYRYTVSDGRLSVMIKGGYPTLGMKYNDMVYVEILDDSNGNLSFPSRFLSNSFVVYEDKDSAPIIADNTLLFELF